MPRYKITFARSARRELQTLPAEIAEHILVKIEALGDNPRPRGCKKLQGPRRLWRIRVGDYRVVYNVDDGGRVVDVVVVRHRSDAYR